MAHRDDLVLGVGETSHQHGLTASQPGHRIISVGGQQVGSNPASHVVTLSNMTYLRPVPRLVVVTGFVRVVPHGCVSFVVHVVPPLGLPRVQGVGAGGGGLLVGDHPVQLGSHNLAVLDPQRTFSTYPLGNNLQRWRIQPARIPADLGSDQLTELATHLLRCPYQLRTPPHEPPRQLGSLISVR